MHADEPIVCDSDDYRARCERRSGPLPMDLADASLIVAAETLTTRKVFTNDRKNLRLITSAEATVTMPSKSLPEFVWRNSPER